MEYSAKKVFLFESINLFAVFIIKTSIHFKESEIKAHFTGRFNGNSYIERSGLKHLDLIDIVFMSNSSNGVLLYNYDVYNDNYLGIKIKNGYIVFEMKIFNKFDRLM